MTKVRYELFPRLESALQKAITGDPDLNNVTKNDPDIAYEIAHHIKISYELGLRRAAQATEYEDISYQWEFGKYALDLLAIANQRAADKAKELGVI